MGLFDRKPKVTTTDNTTPANKDVLDRIKQDNKDMLETAELNGISAAIDQAVQKSFNSLSSYGSEEGGYFGNEFNIMSTAGRFKAAYTREPWVWAAANLIARTLMSAKYKVLDTETGEEFTEHPILKKLDTGNSIQGPKAIKWSSMLDFILGGSFLIIYSEDFSQCEHVPVERFEPNIVEGESGCNIISSFSVSSECGTKKMVVPSERALYVPFPNPFSPFHGMSLFTAASRPIILDRVKNEFELAFYLRGATNSGVIEASEDVNKSRLKLLMKSFEALFTGKRNWHRQLILPKGLTWKPTGSSFTEMKHIEGLRENRLSLLAALSIPPSKLGVTGDVNRATAEAQDRDFWENTIKPLTIFIADSINQSYIVKNVFEGRFKVVPDFSEVTALQGSLVTKGEDAAAVEKYWTLNEIREEIFGKSPLASGDKLLAEISKPQAPQLLSANEIDKPTGLGFVLSEVKSRVTDRQERIVSSLAKDYREKHEKYIQQKITVAEKALESGKNPELALNAADFTEEYNKAVLPILDSARERGFSLSNAQSTAASSNVAKKGMGSVKAPFTPVDQEAIDLLRRENEQGQRVILAERSVEHFKGFDEIRSKQILDRIANFKENKWSTNADGELVIDNENGRHLSDSEIAGALRADYNETYKNQANTIVRTEVLTAVSQGQAEHREVLGQVFTEVQKQWLHVGDSGDHVRDNHKGYEDLGPQPASYEYAPGLGYPRDSGAGPEETINCRCSIVNIVPDSADSNAEDILARS